MPTARRISVCLALLAICLCALAGPASAAQFPPRISWIKAFFVPGASTDPDQVTTYIHSAKATKLQVCMKGQCVDASAVGSGTWRAVFPVQGLRVRSRVTIQAIAQNGAGGRGKIKSLRLRATPAYQGAGGL